VQPRPIVGDAGGGRAAVSAGRVRSKCDGSVQFNRLGALGQVGVSRFHGCPGFSGLVEPTELAGNGSLTARTDETRGPTRIAQCVLASGLATVAAHELRQRQAGLELDAIHGHDAHLTVCRR